MPILRKINMFICYFGTHSSDQLVFEKLWSNISHPLTHPLAEMKTSHEFDTQHRQLQRIAQCHCYSCVIGNWDLSCITAWHLINWQYLTNTECNRPVAVIRTHISTGLQLALAQNWCWGPSGLINQLSFVSTALYTFKLSDMKKMFKLSATNSNCGNMNSQVNRTI